MSAVKARRLNKRLKNSITATANRSSQQPVSQRKKWSQQAMDDDENRPRNEKIQSSCKAR